MAIRIGVCGAAGRMGRTVIQACLDDERFLLGAALERAGHAALGSDAGVLAGGGACRVALTDALSGLVDAVDVCVDFSHPDAATASVQTCCGHATPVVVGTTGFSAEQRSAISEAACQAPVVLAPNMSVGINLCFKLIETAARVLDKDVDIEIIEAHHRHKIDAPSGTALAMGEVIAHALQRDLDDCAVYAREGRTGARAPASIGFQAVRGGDIVGEHTVLFAGAGERIEITHRASSRMNFARGALRAAAWVHGRAAGLYSMADVIGLNAPASR